MDSRPAGPEDAAEGDAYEPSPCRSMFACTGRGRRVRVNQGHLAPDLKTAVEGYLMTDKGLRRLGSGQVDAGGGKTPGVAVPLVVAAASGNPIGLIVGSALKVGGEVTGRSTIEGAAKRTAKEIGDQLQVAFRKQGWI